AVAVRTFAEKNRGRHAKDGYDFCTTTHCQRYQRISELNAGDISTAQAATNARALAAVRATSSAVLRDQTSNLVDSYFSASCGGTGCGHGLGLCQEGAHVMAASGANYEQILAKYFPGTVVTDPTGSSALAESRSFPDVMWSRNLRPQGTMPGGNRRTSLLSEH